MCRSEKHPPTPSGAWHHSPAHVYEPETIHIVTGSTLHKHHYFRGEDRLRMVNDTLFNVAGTLGWELEAWAIFSNHYHFIARSPRVPVALRALVQRIHCRTARHVNQLDGAPGRRVWFQYWDTCLTYEKSYYARLSYVHNNAVKHGLVTVAELYPFCSAGWFRSLARPQLRKKVESFPYDRVNVADDV